MPTHETIEKCVDKAKSYEIWKSEGVKVPETMIINDARDLSKAFGRLGNKEGEIWLRATVGGGGKGSLPTNNFEFAKLWIDRFNGWGKFYSCRIVNSSISYLVINLV